MKQSRKPAFFLLPITFFLLANASAAPLVINGTDGDDTVIVTATTAESGSYGVNGGPAIRFREVTSFTFNGGDGNDRLRIINPRHGLFAAGAASSAMARRSPVRPATSWR